MSKIKRIIPILLLDDKKLVKTVNFKSKFYIGDPINTIKIFNDLMCPELFILNISNEKIDYEYLKRLSSNAFMPLSYGGGINNVDDGKKILEIGFEKLVINTSFFKNDYDNIELFCNNFGSQSIIVSIDIKKNLLGGYKIFNQRSYKNKNLVKAIAKINNSRPSEILITNVDYEGTWKGFDHNLFKFIKSLSDISIIYNGGISSHDELNESLNNYHLDVIASSSVFLYQKKNMGVLINYPYRLFNEN